MRCGASSFVPFLIPHSPLPGYPVGSRTKPLPTTSLPPPAIDSYTPARRAGCDLSAAEKNKRCPVLVPMELARIIISELNDQQVIYLREVEGERMFPILIGLFEATSIDRRIKKEYPQRPLTHDLLKATIEALGGELQSIIISDLREHTYFAKLRVVRNGDVIEIDSRPSDAIALAVHYEPHLPIYVDSEVLDQVL